MTFNLSGTVLALLLGLFAMTPTSQAVRWSWGKPTTWVKNSRVLDLSYQNITSLKKSNIPHLALCTTELNLKHNGIQGIQEGAFAGLSCLQGLDLSSNHLQTVTASMWSGLEALKLLDLRDNRLASLPRRAFRGLTSLQKLFLQKNMFTSIPVAIQGMASLHVLSLAGNQISSVDRGSLQDCQGLKELYLEHNLISEVSAEAFWVTDSLKVLNLSSNQLEGVLAPTIQHLWEHGTAVHLHGNPWRCSCELLELWKQRPGGTAADVGRCHGEVLPGCGVPLELAGTVMSVLHKDRALTLPCGSINSTGKVVYWETPFGRWENSSHVSHAPVELLSDGTLKLGQPTPQHTGLYYCLLQDDEGQSLHPYRVQYVPADRTEAVHLRKSRGAKNGDTVTQSQFAAAVASSVIITFLGGFILGAFSRTYLDRCFWQLRAKHVDKISTRICTLPVRYTRTTFRKDTTGNKEDRVEVDVTFQGASPHETAAPAKASWTTREGEKALHCTGHVDTRVSQRRPSTQDIHPEKVESEESSQQSICISDAEDQVVSGGQTNDLTDEQQTPELCPKPHAKTAKRRAIKLYQYDEDGNLYSQNKNTEDRMPSMRQRSLSLTRLNAIMSAATNPNITNSSPQKEEVQDQESRDNKAVFQLSV